MDETTADVAAPEGGAETTAQQAESQVDLSPIHDRMEQLTSLVQDLGTRIPAAEPEPDPDPFDGWDDSGLFGEPEPQDNTQAARAALADLVTRGSQAQIEKALGPIMERLERVDVRTSARELEAEFPQLKNPEIARAVVGDAQEIAFELAESLGLDEQGAMRLSRSPRLIRMAYQASEAVKAAEAETPADDAVTELESGGGASPGGTGKTKSIIDEVLEDRRGTESLPAWAR